MSDRPKAHDGDPFEVYRSGKSDLSGDLERGRDALWLQIRGQGAVRNPTARLVILPGMGGKGLE